MTKIDLAHCFFILGEPARLRGRRFQASQTHIHGPTPGNVASSRRAVGLFATMFFVIRFRRGVSHTPQQTPYLRAYRMRPHAKNISASIPLARPFATFPRFAANHPIPSPAAFSRAANPASGPSLEIMGTLPEFGYRYATADAVGRGFDSSCP